MLTPKDLKEDSKIIGGKLLWFMVIAYIVAIVFIGGFALWYNNLYLAVKGGSKGILGYAFLYAATRQMPLINAVAIAFSGIILIILNREFLTNAVNEKRRKMTIGNFFCYFVLIVGSTLIPNTLYYMLSNMLDIENASPNISYFTVVYIVALGPIIEEMVFRGIILKNLEKYGKYFAIVVSSVLFGLYHGSIVKGILAFFCGLLLGFVASEYSLFYSILLHICNNFCSVFITQTGLDSRFLGSTVAMSAIIIVLCIFMIIYLNKKNKIIDNYCKVNAPVFTGAYKQFFKNGAVIAFILLMLIRMFI